MQKLTNLASEPDGGSDDREYHTFHNVSTNFCVKDFPPKVQLELNFPGFTDIIKETEACLIRKNKMSKKRTKQASNYFVEYIYRIFNKKPAYVRNHDVGVFKKYFWFFAKDFVERQI